MYLRLGSWGEPTGPGCSKRFLRAWGQQEEHRKHIGTQSATLRCLRRTLPHTSDLMYFSNRFLGTPSRVAQRPRSRREVNHIFPIQPRGWSFHHPLRCKRRPSDEGQHGHPLRRDHSRDFGSSLTAALLVLPQSVTAFAVHNGLMTQANTSSHVLRFTSCKTPFTRPQSQLAYFSAGHHRLRRKLRPHVVGQQVRRPRDRGHVPAPPAARVRAPLAPLSQQHHLPGEVSGAPVFKIVAECGSSDLLIWFL